MMNMEHRYGSPYVQLATGINGDGGLLNDPNSGIDDDDVLGARRAGTSILDEVSETINMVLSSAERAAFATVTLDKLPKIAKTEPLIVKNGVIYIRLMAEIKPENGFLARSGMAYQQVSIEVPFMNLLFVLHDVFDGVANNLRHTSLGFAMHKGEKHHFRLESANVLQQRAQVCQLLRDILVADRDEETIRVLPQFFYDTLRQVVENNTYNADVARAKQDYVDHGKQTYVWKKRNETYFLQQRQELRPNYTGQDRVAIGRVISDGFDIAQDDAQFLRLLLENMIFATFELDVPSQRIPGGSVECTTSDQKIKALITPLPDNKFDVVLQYVVPEGAEIVVGKAQCTSIKIISKDLKDFSGNVRVKRTIQTSRQKVSVNDMAKLVQSLKASSADNLDGIEHRGNTVIIGAVRKPWLSRTPRTQLGDVSILIEPDNFYRHGSNDERPASESVISLIDTVCECKDSEGFCPFEITGLPANVRVQIVNHVGPIWLHENRADVNVVNVNGGFLAIRGCDDVDLVSCQVEEIAINGGSEVKITDTSITLLSVHDGSTVTHVGACEITQQVIDPSSSIESGRGISQRKRKVLGDVSDKD